MFRRAAAKSIMAGLKRSDRNCGSCAARPFQRQSAGEAPTQVCPESARSALVVAPMLLIYSEVRMATWRSGDAADCKSAYPGSIPGVASNIRLGVHALQSSLALL